MVNPDSEAKSGATDPISAILKLKNGLAWLQKSESLKLFFGPDALRDTNIHVDDANEFHENVLGEKSKNRTKMEANINIGGHGALAIITAAKLRQDTNVDCILVAKVQKGAKEEIIGSFINDSIEAKGAAPINTDYVVYDPEGAGKTNLVFEVQSPKSHTSIGTVGGQPKLRLNDFDSGTKEALLEEMSKADVVGMLSLKSGMTKETLKAMGESGLAFREFVSDVTTGDDTAVLTDALEFLVSLKDKTAKITHLSINEGETLRYARLAYARQNNNPDVEQFLGSQEYTTARAELKKAEVELSKMEKQRGMLPSAMRPYKEKIERSEATIKKLSNNFEEGLALEQTGIWEKNPAEAARYLNRYLDIPLAYHTEYGAKVFDHTGKKATSFVPSIHLESISGSLGAGDTRLGGESLALAVMNRLEKDGAPANLRLTMEDVLMIGGVATAFRLQNEMVAGTLDDCYEWVSGLKIRTAAFRPNSNMKDSESYGHLPEFIEAAAVQQRLELLQRAHSESFTGKAAARAQEVVGDFVFKRYSFEERLKALDAEQAVHMAMDAIESRDPVFASAAIDSLRLMARREPKVKEFIRKELGITKQSLAVMHDLDATLFASTAARERAGPKAIQKGLGLTLGGEELDLESSKKLYSTVYDAHDHFRKMGFPDFRQVWNIEQFYAAAVALVEGGGPDGRPPKNRSELSKLLADLTVREKGFSDPNFRNRLVNRMNSLLNDPSYKQRFKAAVEKFEEVGLKPFPDTQRLLSALHELLDAKLYVVTEGDDATQLNKVKMLGLSDFFASGKRVLSTSSAGQDWRAASELAYEETRITEQLREAEHSQSEALAQLLKLGEAQLLNRSSGGKEDQDAAVAIEAYQGKRANAEETMQRLTGQKKLLEWTKHMLERRAQQSGEGGSFYDVALRAINLTPDDIRQGASVGAGGPEEWNACNSFIAVRIGDNFMMDVFPVRRVAPEALTCLLNKRGKYHNQFGQIKMDVVKLTDALERVQNSMADNLVKHDKMEAERRLCELMKVKLEGQNLLDFVESTLPTIEAESLSDILCSLLQRETYKGVKPVSKPKHFVAEAPREEDLDMLMAGSLSDSKVVRVVRENLFSDISLSPAAVENALSHFIKHLDRGHLEGSHDRSMSGDTQIAAADSIASLLASSTKQDGAVHTRGAEALARVFTDVARDPKVRAECLMAFGRIDGDLSWLDRIPEHSNRLEMPTDLVKAYDLVKTSRPRAEPLSPVADLNEKIRIAFGAVNRATTEMRGNRDVSAVKARMAEGFRAQRKLLLG